MNILLRFCVKKKNYNEWYMVENIFLVPEKYCLSNWIVVVRRYYSVVLFKNLKEWIIN